MFFNEIWNYEYADIDSILYEFESETSETVSFDLVNPQGYQKALNDFMQNGTAMRFPESTVDMWFRMIVKNALKISAITELAGHTSYFPTEEITDHFHELEDFEDSDAAFYFLEKKGFYDWCRLPDGSNAWSDYGLKPIFNLIHKWSDNLPITEKLLIIDQILNVAHARGDLASAFIKGGSTSLSQISGQSH